MSSRLATAKDVKPPICVVGQGRQLLRGESVGRSGRQRPQLNRAEHGQLGEGQLADNRCWSAP